jgi:hypothetical protein
MANETEEQLRLATLAALADKTKQEKKDTKKANTTAVAQAAKDKKRVDGLNKKDRAVLEKQYQKAQKNRTDIEKKALVEQIATKSDADIRRDKIQDKWDARNQKNRQKTFDGREEVRQENADKEKELTKQVDGAVANLADKMQEGKKGANDAKNNADLAAKLRDMNAFTNLEANEASVTMSIKFNELTAITQDIENTSEDERRIAQLSLDELSNAANDEEERREKQAEADKMAGVWGRIEQASNRAADNIEGLRNNLLKGGGIVAVLGALALMFTDPETLMEGIKSGLEIIRNIIQGISDFISGDMETKLQMVKDNFGKISLAILALALWFLPTILRSVASIRSGFTKFKNAMIILNKGFKLMRAGIMAAGAAVNSGFAGILATLGITGVALGPAILIGLAIVAAVALIAFGLTKLRDAMGVGSVMDLIFVAWGYVKDGFAHVGNVFITIANVIMDFIGKVAKWFGFEIEMPQMEKMKTNNAETAKTEARQKKAKADAEKAEEEAAAVKKQKEEDALALGPPIVAELEVQGPSEDELEAQKEQDAFRAMMGFDVIEREPLVDSLSPPAVTGIEGIPGVESGEAMANSSAANAKAQANAAGRPDTQPPSTPPIVAVGGNSSSSTTFNTLAPNTSRVSRLNFANQ